MCTSCAQILHNLDKSQSRYLYLRLPTVTSTSIIMPFTRRYCREVNGHFLEIDHSKLNIMVAIKAGLQMIIGTILLWIPLHLLLFN